jgi:hypothetical protein
VAFAGDVAQVEVPDISPLGTGLMALGCGDTGLGAAVSVTVGGHNAGVVFAWMIQVGSKPNLTGGPLGVDVYFSVGG